MSVIVCPLSIGPSTLARHGRCGIVLPTRPDHDADGSLTERTTRRHRRQRRGLIAAPILAAPALLASAPPPALKSP